MTRTYRGRFGQPITDPETIEARRVQTQMRRLITLGVKAGRPWNAAATVGALAYACKLTPLRIVTIVREYQDAWLWGINEVGADMAAWTVYEDGE